jgi:hypothetical protein
MDSAFWWGNWICMVEMGFRLWEVSKVIYIDLLFKQMWVHHAVVLWILLFWLRLVKIEIVLATAATGGNHFAPVQGSSQSLCGCENIRCPAASSFWAFVKCRRFWEKFRRRSEQFHVFLDQPQTNPHLTPVVISWCKYQDSFCVLVSGQVMETSRYIYCSCTGCRRNQLTLETICYKHRVSVTFTPFCICSAFV